jgi:hypothetical protein
MAGRKSFARMHVGFVNINTDRAKCGLVIASGGQRHSSVNFTVQIG